MFYSRKAYFAHRCKNMLYHPYSYRSTIDENPIPIQRICVLSYLCLILAKVLFETSFMSFQYNTEGRPLSNYSIKMILCSHYRSRCKGLCQNKKHEFDQYTKGGHFCAAHMALNARYYSPFSNKLLGQGYVKERLKSSLRKFYGRYGDLTKQYVPPPLFQMLHDILDDDHIQ